jgi:hypothetical protein
MAFGYLKAWLRLCLVPQLVKLAKQAKIVERTGTVHDVSIEGTTTAASSGINLLMSAAVDVVDLNPAITGKRSKWVSIRQRVKSATRFCVTPAFGDLFSGHLITGSMKLSCVVVQAISMLLTVLWIVGALFASTICATWFVAWHIVEYALCVYKASAHLQKDKKERGGIIRCCGLASVWLGSTG